MKARTKAIWTTLHVISWIIFIGLCVRTGAVLYTSLASLYFNPAGARNLYSGLNLSPLYDYDTTYYMIITSLIVVASAAKAVIFYLVIKIFSKINYLHPFSKQVASLIAMIGYISLGVGILSLKGMDLCEWMTKNGVDMPPMERHLGAGAEFILFAGVIFFIAQVFKRGIELQTENELTV